MLTGARRILTDVRESVQGGSTFAEALAQHPKVFDRFFVSMVKAGEAGGVLELVLSRLGEFMEKAERLKSKIKGAMVYPVVVLIIAAGILIFMMVKIVPEFAQIFQDMLGTSELPGLTRFVMSVSSTIVKKGLYVLGAVIVYVKMIHVEHIKKSLFLLFNW